MLGAERVGSDDSKVELGSAVAIGLQQDLEAVRPIELGGAQHSRDPLDSRFGAE